MHTSLKSPQARCVSCEDASHTVPSPHAGEGQGGGGDSAPRATLLQRADSENQESWSGVYPDRIGNNRCACCTPSLSLSPAWGEGTLWHRSSHLGRRTRVRVPRCVHAQREGGDDKERLSPALLAAARIANELGQGLRRCRRDLVKQPLHGLAVLRRELAPPALHLGDEGWIAHRCRERLAQ
jgi:hypothetical protein